MVDDRKFNKAMETMTPRALKWADELITSINSLKFSEEEKEAMLIRILEIVLFKSPYPNRVIVVALAKVISDISGEEELGDLTWKKRQDIFRRKRIR